MRGRSERLPDPLANHVSRLLSQPRGAKPVTTQVAGTAAGRIWIFFYGKKMCLAQEALGSVACSSMSLARSRGVVLGTFKPPSKEVPRMHGFQLIGIMPDDVRYVSATVGRMHQKRYIRVPVRHNVFAVSAERPVLVRGVVRR